MQTNYFKELDINSSHSFSEILWNNTVYIRNSSDKGLYLYDLEKNESKSIGEFGVRKILKVSSNGNYLVLSINGYAYPILYDVEKNQIIDIYKDETNDGVLFYDEEDHFNFDISEKYLIINFNNTRDYDLFGYIFNIESKEITEFTLYFKYDQINELSDKYNIYFYIYLNDSNYLIVYDDKKDFKIMNIQFSYCFKRISYNKYVNLSIKHKIKKKKRRNSSDSEEENEENRSEEENEEENRSDSEEENRRSRSKDKIDILYQFNNSGVIRRIKNFNLIYPNEELRYSDLFYVKNNNLVFFDNDLFQESYEIIYINDNKYKIKFTNFISFDYGEKERYCFSVNGKYLLKDSLRTISQCIPLINSPLNCERLLEMWKKKDAYLISGDKELAINKFLASLYSRMIEEYLIENNNSNEIYLSDEIELNEISLIKINQVFLDTFHGITDTYPLVRKYLLLTV